MTDMRTAREINLRVPALLTSALEHARSIDGSEASVRAAADFRATLADMPDSAHPGAITFAVARLAAQMIDQLAVEAGMDAELVIQHFATGYNASIDED